jgi:hypothetical protein
LSEQPTARLYAILARRAPVGVIFRRGPSGQVLLIRWNTDEDSFEPGQWFKGRIYERRCDLSPDGDLLLYFAANWRRPDLSWSAVSRPPYLTALALWPKGDKWGGGGHFLAQNCIALNHWHGEESHMTATSSLPEGMRVQPFGEDSGWGEDNPIWAERLKRDGWVVACEGIEVRTSGRTKVWTLYEPPMVFQKPHPREPDQYLLTMAIYGMHEKDGPWYHTEHTILRGGSDVAILGRTEWADWSPSGDLLFSKGGRLFRLRYDGGLPAVSASVEIADLSRLRFEARESPMEARVWP